VYTTDGYVGYRVVSYQGECKHTTGNEADTYTVEDAHSDVRTYSPTLQRRRRCFPRKIEHLNAVLTLCAYAYSRFGQWEDKYCCISVKHTDTAHSNKLHTFTYPNLSFIDSLLVCLLGTPESSGHFRQEYTIQLFGLTNVPVIPEY
jgi:hypothetical protein